MSSRGEDRELRAGCVSRITWRIVAAPSGIRRWTSAVERGAMASRGGVKIGAFALSETPPTSSSETRSCSTRTARVPAFTTTRYRSRAPSSSAYAFTCARVLGTRTSSPSLVPRSLRTMRRSTPGVMDTSAFAIGGPKLSFILTGAAGGVGDEGSMDMRGCMYCRLTPALSCAGARLEQCMRLGRCAPASASTLR